MMTPDPRDFFAFLAGHANEETRRALTGFVVNADSTRPSSDGQPKDEADLLDDRSVDWLALAEAAADELSDDAPASVAEQATGRRGWLARRSRLAQAAIITLTALSSLVLGAASTYLLVRDDFNEGWFDQKVWEAPSIPDGRTTLEIQSGFARLTNRAYLVTREEYGGPLSITLDWKWIDHTRGEETYADHLAIALRTTGRPRTSRPYEPIDGVIVKFVPFGGFVSVAFPDVDVDIARTENTGMVIPMPPNTWHRIRITDDGETINVYFAQRDAAIETAATPVLRVPCTRQFPGHRIAVYNREHVAYPHESWIDNVTIRQLNRGVRDFGP